MSALTWGHEPLLEIRGPRIPRTPARAVRRGAGRPTPQVVGRPSGHVVARPTLQVVAPAAGQVVVRPAERGVARPAGSPARRRAVGADAVGADAGGVRIGAVHGERAAVSSPTAPSMHLTARGWVTLVALSAGLALWGALSAPSAVADRPGEARAVVAHTVAPGETLWRVAQSIATPHEDIRDVVDELMVLNGLASGQLRAGQQILVPAG